MAMDEMAPRNLPLSPPAAASIVTVAAGWAAAVTARVKLTAELALAEAKLAAISISLMAFLAMLAAAFALGAWGLLLAGLTLGLLQQQIPLWPMLFVLGGLHVLIAAAAWRGAVKLSHNLEFPVTRQQLNYTWEAADDMASATGQG
jgi:uncharacterized membrane protein YqjE